LTTGDDLELRVAQVRFWEGYFVRSGIDLQTQYGASVIQVTDLDLLAFSFGPHLEPRKTIGESKSGSGRSAPKPLDRIVWLRGLRALVSADSAELTIKGTATRQVRDLGRQLGVTVQSMADLKAREDAVQLKAVAGVGAYGVEAVELRERVRVISQSDPVLQSAYKFVRSTVWFLDPFAAAKQTIGLLSTLTMRWVPKVEDDANRAVRWLIAESVSVLGLNILLIASQMQPMSPKEFSELIEERLSDGLVPAAKMKELSKRIDRYVAGLLAAADAPTSIRADAMGAFFPEPPDFASSLAELAVRFARAHNGATLPRRIEMLMHERVARGRQPSSEVAERLGLAEIPTEISAFAAFLRRFTGLTADISSALTSPVIPGAGRTAAAIGSQVTQPSRRLGDDTLSVFESEPTED